MIGKARKERAAVLPILEGLTDVQRAAAVEAMLCAEHRDNPVMWPDAYEDAVARIKRIKMDWALDGLIAHFATQGNKS